MNTNNPEGSVDDAFIQGEHESYSVSGVPEFIVSSWCPTPEPTVPPTQVHLRIHAEKFEAVIRFKGPAGLDSLISALLSHRLEVWGAP